MPLARTKTERQLEEAMAIHAGDPERVQLLDRARRFKRSWIELAEVLVRAREDEAWTRWGFRSFDDYCARELHLRGGTVDKLCASLGYLRTHAPRLLRDDDEDLTAPVPTWQAVDFVARAEERGAAPAETLAEMRRAVFDEGAAAPALSRRYGEVAFPVSARDRRERAREQLLAAARRLADAVADPDAGVAAGMVERVQALVGEIALSSQRSAVS